MIKTLTKMVEGTYLWSSNTLAIWCIELTHWKRPWCWERLKAGGEGDDRGWDGWMASLSQWTWVWAISGSWWWTGRPGMLQSIGSQKVGHYWATELNWTEVQCGFKVCGKGWIGFLLPQEDTMHMEKEKSGLVWIPISLKKSLFEINSCTIKSNHSKMYSSRLLLYSTTYRSCATISTI